MSLYLFDIRAGTISSKLAGEQSNWVTFLAPHPVNNNTILASYADGSIKLWDLHAGQIRGSVDAGEGGEAWTVAWLDGDRCIAGGERGFVKVYRVER